MKITAQQFISNSKEKGTFVSVFKYYSEEAKQKTLKGGDLYCLLSISGSQELPAERVCKFVWDGILDGYLYSSSKTTNESLKDAITEGVRKLKDLMKNDKSLEELGVNLNFVLVAQKKEGLYIGNLGDNNAFVFKDGKLVNITDILGKSKASTAGVALNKGDVLVVSTGGVVSQNIEKLETLQEEGHLIDYLKDLGKSLENSAGLLFFGYESTESTTEEVVQAPQTLISKNFLKKEGNKLSKLTLPEINLGNNLHLDFKKPQAYINSIFEKVRPFFKKVGNIFKTILSKCERLTKSIWAKLETLLGKKRWYKKVASTVSQVKINVPKYSPKGMRIDGYRVNNVRNKRIRLILMVVLIIVLLAVGINLTIKLKTAREIHSQANTVFTTVENLVSKAENMVTSDEDSTKTAIYQAKNAMNELPANMDEKDVTTKNNLESRILNVEDTLYKRVGFTDSDGKLSTFLDTRLAFGDGSNPTDIEMYSDDSGNEYLLITDSGLNGVYRVSLYDKSVEKVPDSDSLIKNPLYISMGNTGAFVYDKKTGVLRAAFDDDGWFKSFVSLSGLTADDINADSQDIAEFIVLTSSDNVYLVARDEGALLKSTFSYGNRYGLIYKYIEDEGLTSTKDILADLSLYFLTSSDTPLIRYSYDYVAQEQALDSLSISGLENDFSDLSKGYTRESLYYGLYLFDAANKNIMKFEKPIDSGEDIIHPDEAVLKEQFIYRGSKTGVWSNVKDIVVNDDETAMYVLDGTAVWKIVL